MRKNYKQEEDYDDLEDIEEDNGGQPTTTTSTPLTTARPNRPTESAQASSRNLGQAEKDRLAKARAKAEGAGGKAASNRGAPPLSQAETRRRAQAEQDRLAKERARSGYGISKNSVSKTPAARSAGAATSAAPISRAESRRRTQAEEDRIIKEKARSGYGIPVAGSAASVSSASSSATPARNSRKSEAIRRLEAQKEEDRIAKERARGGYGLGSKPSKPGVQNLAPPQAASPRKPMSRAESRNEEDRLAKERARGKYNKAGEAGAAPGVVSGQDRLAKARARGGQKETVVGAAPGSQSVQDRLAKARARGGKHETVVGASSAPSTDSSQAVQDRLAKARARGGGTNETVVVASASRAHSSMNSSTPVEVQDRLAKARARMVVSSSPQATDYVGIKAAKAVDPLAAPATMIVEEEEYEDDGGGTGEFLSQVEKDLLAKRSAQVLGSVPEKKGHNDKPSTGDYYSSNNQYNDADLDGDLLPIQRNDDTDGGEVMAAVQAFVPDAPEKRDEILEIDTGNVVAFDEVDEDKAARSYVKRWMIIAAVVMVIVVVVTVPVSIKLSQVDPTESPTETPSLSPSTAPSTDRTAQIFTFLSEVTEFDVLSDRESPQYQAAIWMSLEDKLSLGLNEPNFLQRYALATFYFATSGDDWKRCSRGDRDCEKSKNGSPGAKHAFLSGFTECEWWGTFCDDSGMVDRISPPGMGDRPGNYLDGTLPRELSLITSMTELSLPSSSFKEFPEWIGDLTSLKTLVLYGDEMKGPIPESLYSLVNLTDLRIQRNSLNGTISTRIGNLVNMDDVFNVRANKLYGEIPTEIGKLTNLVSLYLYDNELTFIIPETMFDMTSIEEIDLSNNKLSGTVPPNFAKLDSLEELFLNKNDFIGAIPDAMGSMTNLEILKIEENDITKISESVCDLVDLFDLEITADESVVCP